MLEKQLFLEAAVELRTVRDLVRWGCSQFNAANLNFGHGTDNAWDEAASIVLHVLHFSPLDNRDIAQTNLTTTERQKILKLFERRIKEKIPAAYLIHKAWFAGLEFYVDEHVLVPRSPMAEIIEQHFEPWIEASEVTKILDLCTGSGCIAIACAAYFGDIEVDAVDISAEALTVAAKNVERHELTNQVHLIQSDLFSKVPQQAYDVIISNPPYVDLQDMQNLPSEYHHEPQLGLAGGKDGLDIVVKILQQASDYLSPHGILIVEVGNSETALIERFPEVPFVWLEFSRGGDGVFLLTAEKLLEYRNVFKKA